MSNIHGLHSNRQDDSDSEDDENNRFVGGIGDRGGGSGLAVRPNPDDIFQQAEGVSAEDSGEARRTSITMYRDGFVVDDGPYRRLDDPANANFLRSLASGQTPRELAVEGDVVIGLIDKRKEDYKESFKSFMGQGASLGTSASSSGAGGSNVFDADELATAPAPAAVNESLPGTQIQVRLLNGQRLVVRTALNASVSELAARIVHAAGGSNNEVSGRFRLVAGFPPKPLADGSVSVEEAGLKGAQVSLQKASE
ncbi:hypothetical protein MPSEU_000739000 [Mayamaea pseudoterrestris]|nr:hypothetical protein MPSEU_000739000 [Mayamaea pseudoterrestris]